MMCNKNPKSAIKMPLFLANRVLVKKYDNSLTENIIQDKKFFC